MELNIHSRKIQLRLISSVNKTVTKYLSDLYEGPLSKLLETLINNPYHDLSQYDCNLIGDFLVALYARDPDMLPKTYKKTVIAKGLNIPINAPI